MSCLSNRGFWIIGTIAMLSFSLGIVTRVWSVCQSVYSISRMQLRRVAFEEDTTDLKHSLAAQVALSPQHVNLRTLDKMHEPNTFGNTSIPTALQGVSPLDDVLSLQLGVYF
ncbi:hypothetical protein MRB53_037743 [Persea americana]|nr:hypothetical protein MRB53_037743 [Persea americana]